MKKIYKAVGAVFAIGAIVFVIALVVREYNAQRNKEFRACFGIPRPRTAEEKITAMPAVFAKLNQIAGSLSEKRVYRDHLRAEVNLKESQQISSVERDELEGRWQASVEDVRGELQAIDAACSLAGEIVQPFQAPCNPDHNEFSTTGSKNP